MILILLTDENSIINLDKFIYTRICQENVFKQPNDYEYTKQFSVNAVFEDGVVRRISPYYDSREKAEIFASCLFGKIKHIEDRHNIFIDASEIDLEVQERKKTKLLELLT
jgi:hypothetical protein